MSISYEIENAICEGCGRRVGPIGCCDTISKLQQEIAIYEFALNEIAKTKTMTVRGECCRLGTCTPGADGSSCSYRSGAHRAFEIQARAADRVLGND